MSSTVDPIKVRRLLSQIESVPTLPTVVSELFEQLRSPRTSADDINRIIVMDQSLTSKVLRVANSAFYGFPRKISSVTHAVVILGFETVRNLALTISVFSAFGSTEKSGFDRLAFWRHSLACAVIARSIAVRLKFKDLEDIFIMGLLHDLGKVILDQYFPDEFSQIVQRAKENNTLIIDAEKDVLGISHPLVGAVVAEGWSLPSAITQVMRYHHTPGSSQTALEASSMVHIGDVLARTKKIGSGGDDLVPPLRTEALKALKLTPSELGIIAKQLDDEIHKMDSFLEMAR